MCSLKEKKNLIQYFVEKTTERMFVSSCHLKLLATENNLDFIILLFWGNPYSSEGGGELHKKDTFSVIARRNAWSFSLGF